MVTTKIETVSEAWRLLQDTRLRLAGLSAIKIEDDYVRQEERAEISDAVRSLEDFVLRQASKRKAPRNWKAQLRLHAAVIKLAESAS